MSNIVYYVVIGYLIGMLLAIGVTLIIDKYHVPKQLKLNKLKREDLEYLFEYKG